VIGDELIAVGSNSDAWIASGSFHKFLSRWLICRVDKTSPSALMLSKTCWLAKTRSQAKTWASKNGRCLRAAAIIDLPLPVPAVLDLFGRTRRLNTAAIAHS
jgi:hypothetical protein